MTAQNNIELAPQFEGVLMPHDGIMQALADISREKLLPADAVRKVLLGEKYPFTQVKGRDGKPYIQMWEGKALQRYYIFMDAQEPDNPARMLALVCNVTRDTRSGVILVMPHEVLRGAEADAVLSVKYGCCKDGGPTVVYTDTRANGQVFACVRSSGTDVRAYIASQWAGLQVRVLDANGMAALHHMALDLSGRCGTGLAGHDSRAGYTPDRLKGAGLTPS